ncbi:MAG: Helix-turn-helix domain, partial [Bacteroidota bacterium]
LFLLCHIVNFMNENKMCFPSNKKLIEQCKFSESKILRIKNELVTRKIISVKQRFRPDGSQTSNLYRIETDLIGVFVTGKNMSNLEPHPSTDEDGGTFTHEGGTPLSTKGHEVLTNLSINQKEVLSSKNSIEFCQNEEIEIIENCKKKINPFQAVSDVEKERKIVATQKERKPNPNYEAFTVFCQTFEQLSGANYPTDQNGHYIMMPKDAGNMVYLMRFIDKIDRNGNSHEALKIFMQAAWSLNDKWLKANFTIANLYSQASKIFTAYQTTSPAAKDKAFNDKLAELLAERMAKFED